MPGLHDNEPVEWYRISRKLGKGGYASVYEVVDVLSGRRYAMKKYKLTDRSDGLNSSILKDFTVSAVTNHPSVVKIWRVHQTRRHVYVFMDLYCLSLQDVLLYIHRHCVSQCPGGWEISSASMDERTSLSNNATNDSMIDEYVDDSQYCDDLILRFISNTPNPGFTRWRQSTCVRVRREVIETEQSIKTEFIWASSHKKKTGEPVTSAITTFTANTATTTTTNHTSPTIASPVVMQTSDSSSVARTTNTATNASPAMLVLRYTTPGEVVASATGLPFGNLSPHGNAVKVQGTVSTATPAVRSSLSSASLDKVTLLQRYIDPLLLRFPSTSVRQVNAHGGTTTIVNELCLLPEHIVLHWFHLCVQGLTHMYTRRFTNGDLKPGNIMIDLTSNRACLIDFNLCQTVHRSLDRLEYPTWTVRPPEYDQPQTDLHPHAVEAWTAGCLLLMLLIAQPTLFDHDVQSGMPSCDRRRARGEMVQAFWRQVGILPTVDRGKCYAHFPALKRYSPFVCDLVFQLLAPEPLQRVNLFDVERLLQQHRFPRPGPHPRSLLTTAGRTLACVEIADGVNTWVLQLPHVAAMESGNQRATAFRFHSDTVARVVTELAEFCTKCMRNVGILATSNRAFIMRQTINAAQLQWMTRPPVDVDGSEVMLLALYFFDSIRASVTTPITHHKNGLISACTSTTTTTTTTTTPSFKETTEQHARMYTHCLLLSERIVFNTNYTLSARTSVLQETHDALVDGMQKVVATQHGNMQPATFYTLMRMLVELQFGIWWPHLRASVSSSIPTTSSSSTTTTTTHSHPRSLSWQRGADSMAVLQAVLVDPQCYQYHPLQLCLSVWWVCQGKWSSVEWQSQLGWDGRLEPALFRLLQQQAPGVNLSSHCVISIASRHLLPLLADLIRCRQLPHPLLETMRNFVYV